MRRAHHTCSFSDTVALYSADCHLQENLEIVPCSVYNFVLWPCAMALLLFVSEFRSIMHIGIWEMDNMN